MPYLKVKQGNKWCIYKEGKDKQKIGATLGCHPTEEKADKQLAVLNINVVEGLMKKKDIEENQDEETVVADTAEVYRSWDLIDKADVPYGAKTFEDVAAAREATKLMERLENTTAIFYSLFWNIWRDYEVPMNGKVAAWKGLFEDFAGAFEAEMGAEEVFSQELEELAEDAGGKILKVLAEDNPRDPLAIDVVILEPGFGNSKDNHYYPKEMLRRDAKAVFEGAKMYLTDHRQDEKSVRTEVSKVQEVIGFTKTGAPVGRVIVWNPDFAEDIRNREKLGELGSLECSIWAKGRVKKGKIDGKKANIVEAIIPTSFTNIDWVTNAGAGGRALRLSESRTKEEPVEQPTEEQVVIPLEEEAVAETEIVEAILHEGEDEAPADEKEEISAEETTGEAPVEEAPVEEETTEEAAFLGAEQVLEILSESHLPKAAADKLASGEYLTEAALSTAIVVEKDYIKKITGSGMPQLLGESGPIEEPVSEKDVWKEHDEAISGILQECGLNV